MDGRRQRRSIKPTKVDKKFLLFGEKDAEEGQSNTGLKEENHFMASIQRTLREAMDGLTATAEVITTAECLCKRYYCPCLSVLKLGQCPLLAPVGLRFSKWYENACVRVCVCVVCVCVCVYVCVCVCVCGVYTCGVCVCGRNELEV